VPADSSNHGLVIRLVLQRVVERFDIFELRKIERLQDVTAVLVLLLRQAVDVDDLRERFALMHYMA
jgi:hypothetical protein